MKENKRKNERMRKEMDAVIINRDFKELDEECRLLAMAYISALRDSQQLMDQRKAV